jgi:hypothetical protein
MKKQIWRSGIGSAGEADVHVDGMDSGTAGAAVGRAKR